MTAKPVVPSTQPTDSEPIEVVPGMFTRPGFLANWDNWRCIKVVSLEQAVFLSFGVEPDIGYYNGRCWPAQELARREHLAIMNLGPGGAIRGVGDAARMPPLVLGISPRGHRVDLVSFADWVIKNDMPLALGCPRSPPSSLARQHGQREQQTRSRVLGMVALALAKRLGHNAQPGKRPRVSLIRNAAMKAIKDDADLKGLKDSTLDKYIAEGLKALESDWPL